MEVLLLYSPMLILFIIYYKVFRIAADVKEIKAKLNNKIQTELLQLTLLVEIYLRHRKEITND